MEKVERLLKEALKDLEDDHPSQARRMIATALDTIADRTHHSGDFWSGHALNQTNLGDLGEGLEVIKKELERSVFGRPDGFGALELCNRWLQSLAIAFDEKVEEVRKEL